MSKALALCLIFFASTQLLTFFQMNGQFLSEWCKNHPFTLSLLGVPISYGFIMATKYAFIEFGGMLWPGRLIGFSTGMILFAFCTYIFFGEGLNTKTITTLVLSVMVILIQIFWK
jgi:hypothetical protein